ncbi:hypothetical protein RchiOBHm_Chr6g0262211 [Rosa chinensis]|uniref:Uncharacterized protein n=1 Tax=Rosa chinensis TaxID=74649 RepID=A0A2P6PNL5_ROSCH|nr:hypothetical protein RchiOBHm_Chr6g0262211 [Rosa chinensis]
MLRDSICLIAAGNEEPKSLQVKWCSGAGAIVNHLHHLRCC